MTPFKLTEELLTEIEQLIDKRQNHTLRSMMEDYHYADIAEVIDELDEEFSFIFIDHFLHFRALRYSSILLDEGVPNHVIWLDGRCAVHCTLIVDTQ